MKKTAEISKKILILFLTIFLCFSLISCGKNDKEAKTDNSETPENTSSQAPEIPPNSIDNELTPVSNVEAITDPEVIKTLTEDLTEVANLTADPSYKGVELIAKHDGKLKSIPIEYPFVNWVSEQKKPVLIEFWASYSEPAKKSLPYLYAMADKYDGDLLVCKVNVEEMPGYVDTFELKYVPTFYVSKDLTLFIVSTGFDPYANPSLPENIEQVIKK